MKTQTAKEKGILFSGPMVRAILEGRKTQTRRIVKPQPYKGCEMFEPEYIWQDEETGRFMWAQNVRPGKQQDEPISCPYPVGTRLWVKERWGYDNEEYVQTYKKEPWRGQPCSDGAEVYYLATEVSPHIFPKGYWKSSRFMPKWASRIWLEVTGVRCERLQDISEEDAIAEGIETIDGKLYRAGDFVASWRNYDPRETASYWNSPRDSYHSLWDSINGPGAWDRNDWVFAYTFRRLASLDSLAGEAE